ncbi:unnamed protein product [Trichobilharzia regenti]|nr:unnamed protein product [Trichobilharzia regenti]
MVDHEHEALRSFESILGSSREAEHTAQLELRECRAEVYSLRERLSAKEAALLESENEIAKLNRQLLSLQKQSYNPSPVVTNHVPNRGSPVKSVFENNINTSKNEHLNSFNNAHSNIDLLPSPTSSIEIPINYSVRGSITSPVPCSALNLKHCILSVKPSSKLNSQMKADAVALQCQSFPDNCEANVHKENYNHLIQCIHGCFHSIHCLNASDNNNNNDKAVAIKPDQHLNVPVTYCSSIADLTKDSMSQNLGYKFESISSNKFICSLACEEKTVDHISAENSSDFNFKTTCDEISCKLASSINNFLSNSNLNLSQMDDSGKPVSEDIISSK